MTQDPPRRGRLLPRLLLALALAVLATAVVGSVLIALTFLQQA